MGPGVSIATDLTEGVIDRFRTLPTARSAYLVGHFLAELVGMVVAIAILLVTGLVVGWRVHTDVLHASAAIALLLVFAAGAIWLGTWIGMLVRSPDAVQGIVFMIVFPLTFVSSAFVPIDSMPEALQWVASYNPVSALAAAVRELFGNPTTPVTKDAWPLEHPVAASWLYCAAAPRARSPGRAATLQGADERLNRLRGGSARRRRGPRRGRPRARRAPRGRPRAAGARSGSCRPPSDAVPRASIGCPPRLVAFSITRTDRSTRPAATPSATSNESRYEKPG